MPKSPAERPAGPGLSWFLGLYAGLVLFGTLYPFRDWLPWQTWSPAFLFAPPPPFITRTDLLTNVLVYAPLGYALALKLSPRLPRRRMILAAAALCLGFSLLLESLQVLLPQRIASNVDIASNGLGALLGGLLARQHPRWLRLAQAIGRWRGQWFQGGAVVNLGLALLGLWFLAQFSLVPVSGLGWLPLYLQPIEAGLALARLNGAWFGAVFLEMAALGAVAALLLRPGRRVWGLTLLFASALLTKVLIALLLLRLKVLGGVLSLETLAAFVAAYWLLRLPILRRQGLAAAAALLAGIVVLRLALGKFILIPNASPFNIVGLADLTGSLWPYLGLVWLVLSWRRPPRPS